MLSNHRTPLYRLQHQLRHLQIPLSRRLHNVHPRRVNSLSVSMVISKREHIKVKTTRSMWAPTSRRPTRATAAVSPRRIYRTARSVSRSVSVVRHMICTHLRRSMPPTDRFRLEFRRQLYHFQLSQLIHILLQDSLHFVSLTILVSHLR